MRRLVNCLARTFNADIPFSLFSSFLPYFSSLCFASVSVNPFLLEASCLRTSSLDKVQWSIRILAFPYKNGLLQKLFKLLTRGYSKRFLWQTSMMLSLLVRDQLAL